MLQPINFLTEHALEQASFYLLKSFEIKILAEIAWARLFALEFKVNQEIFEIFFIFVCGKLRCGLSI